MDVIPALDRLHAAKRVLLLGAGGGYDVLGAVPLYVELRSRGVAADLASLSFTTLEALPGAVAIPDATCLYRLDASAASTTAYCPEAWLARWVEETGKGEPVVWAFNKVGVRPLRGALAVLIERLGTDLVVLVDGGVDLALRGDETSIGTPAEDLATLCATAALELPSMAMCVGFGTELREGIPHAQVLERFAELQRCGAFLGAIGLHATSPWGIAYREALDFVRRGQSQVRGSHVHDVVSAAIDGRFGAEAADTWISPLATLCWFFDSKIVAASHLFLRHLEATETIWEVTNVIRSVRKGMDVRERSAIPI